MPDFRALRTVFDSFEPAFLIIEYLSVPEFPTDYLSEVLAALELVVVARIPENHTYQNRKVLLKWLLYAGLCLLPLPFERLLPRSPNGASSEFWDRSGR